MLNPLQWVDEWTSRPASIRSVGCLRRGGHEQNDSVTLRQALPHEESARAIETVPDSDSAQPAVRLAFEFLVLTATRFDDVRLATWDELDTVGAV